MLLSSLLLVSLTCAAAQSSSEPAAASASASPSAAPNSTAAAGNSIGDGAAVGTMPHVNFTRSYFTFPVDFVIDSATYPPPPGSNSTIMLEQTVKLKLFAEGQDIPITWTRATPQGSIWCVDKSSCSFADDLLPTMRYPATNPAWPALKYRATFNETLGWQLDPATLLGNPAQRFYVQLVGDGKGQLENHTLNHDGPICNEWAASPAKPSAAAAVVAATPALVTAAVLFAVLV
ncbi:uncharacterized protein LOC62_03G004445 [Vanrija pseudolonga]|uniref:Uncharacterized protein n=1 Tax=Vanrija pseudolonga TaxID=143232 RepID=A0AAF0YA82_9TREE|nr:hypothetical protein LOC62_03G004445 [Vanrija pseudolonga]